MWLQVFSLQTWPVPKCLIPLGQWGCHVACPGCQPRQDPGLGSCGALNGKRSLEGALLPGGSSHHSRQAWPGPGRRECSRSGGGCSNLSSPVPPSWPRNMILLGGAGGCLSPSPSDRLSPDPCHKLSPDPHQALSPNSEDNRQEVWMIQSPLLNTPNSLQMQLLVINTSIRGKCVCECKHGMGI